MSFPVIAVELSCPVNYCQGVIKFDFTFLIFDFFDVTESYVAFKSFGLLNYKLKLFSLHLGVWIRKGILVRWEVVADEGHFWEHDKVDFLFWGVDFERSLNSVDRIFSVLVKRVNLADEYLNVFHLDDFGLCIWNCLFFHWKQTASSFDIVWTKVN